MVVHTCNPNAWEAEAGGWQVGGQPSYMATPCLRKTKAKKVKRSMQEARSMIPSTAQKKKKKNSYN
jgi:hypothetical protein